MRNLLVIISFLSTLFVSCHDKDIKVLIKNKSNETVNELLVFVQGKKFTVDKIKVNEYSEISISENSISINAHDFRIESTYKLKNGNINRGFYYSDLSSRPNSKYIIEVYNNHIVIK